MGNKHTKDVTKTAPVHGEEQMKEVDDGNSGLISFQTYGEATTVPIKIQRAVFDASDPAPFLRRYLASIELTVVNTAVPKDTSGKLRIAVPVGSTVKKFEVLRTDLPTPGWYPAVAVPKKKAKEVVYREIEKGRDVAAVSDVASNVFEIEVSPLPFGVEVKCRLECVLVGDVGDLRVLAETYFPDDDTEVFFAAAAGAGEVSPNGEYSDVADVGGAVVGESFGKTHFVCRVPSFSHRGSGCKSGEEHDVNNINRIAVVWDVSASMAKPANLIQSRCERLRELAVECNRHIEKPVVFELYTFGVGAAIKEGTFDNVEDMLSAIAAFDYDGGTDTTELPALFAQFCRRKNSAEVAGIDSVLVFTDGMDNLGRLPQFEGLQSVPFPVNVVADSETVNLRSARAIASTSPQYPGSIFSRMDESYVPGVLYPQAILKSIKTDQSEDAFMEEVDDGFRCVPDHRLQHLNQVIGSEGMLISGVLGGEDMSTVSNLVAQVAYGSESHEYCFQLRSKSLIDGNIGKKAKSGHGQKQIHHYEAESILPLKQIEQTSSKQVDPSRILGYVYAEETYRAAENFGFKSGINIKVVREELSVQYGFCSPESSLLMLYTVQQFLDNDVVPPEEHPVFNDERAIQARKKREQEKTSKAAGSKVPSGEGGIARGEIGAPKNEKQKTQVVRLAQELERYFNAPAVSVEDFQQQRSEAASRSAGALLGRAGRIATASNMELFRSAPRRSRGVMLCSAESRSSRQPTRISCSATATSSPRRQARGAMMGMRLAPAGSRMANRSARQSLGSSRVVALMSEDVGEEEEMDMDMGSTLDIGAPGSPPSPGASNIRGDRPAVAPPKDPKLYVGKIEEVLKNQSQAGEWKKEYQTQREQMSGSGVPSPSFFLTCARLALKYSKTFDAIKIVTNCLEMEVEDVQMLRCVAYFLLSTKDQKAVGLAQQLFDKVQELQPCEPQSFLDSALVRFWMLASYKIDNSMEKRELTDMVVNTQNLIVRVLTHTWADRFSEVEWPALILLHYVAVYVKDMNDKLQLQDAKDALPEWPTSELALYGGGSKVARVLDWGANPLRCSKFDPALMVWMGWDSDKTDVDLHVVEPTKNEVYYGNRTSSVGGRLSRDFTQGYGPEIYILRDRKAVADLGLAGKYDIYAKYFASHQDSVLTGATSVLLWTIEKNKKSGENSIEFLNVRLDTHKEKTKITTVQLEGI